MSIDEEKNDSQKILPKINWKEKLINMEKANEKNNKVWKKNLLHFNGRPKRLKLKSSPTHTNLNNLYKSIKFNKEENSNDKEEQTTTNFFSKNNYFNDEINNSIGKNIMECEFNKFLKNTKKLLLEMKSKKGIIKEKLKGNDNSKIKIKYRKKLSTQFMMKNKLIANKIKKKDLWNNKNYNKRIFFRNKNHSSIFNHTSFNMSFSNETYKSSKTMINLKHLSNNISFREKNKKKLKDSLNSIAPKILSTPLNKKNQSKEKEIFISKLNIKSARNNKKSVDIKLRNTYIKKWDLPKSFSFDKLPGRNKEIKSFKLHCLERICDYSPKYDSVLSNRIKGYIKYCPDLNIDFDRYKKNITRKFIYNHRNLMNSPANNYNIINILNEKKLEMQEILEKKKLNKIVEEFIHFNRKKV